MASQLNMHSNNDMQAASLIAVINREQLQASDRAQCMQHSMTRVKPYNTWKSGAVSDNYSTHCHRQGTYTAVSIIQHTRKSSVP
jgi:hypothetical protein